MLNRIAALLAIGSFAAVATLAIKKIAAHPAFAIQRVIVSGDIKRADPAHIAAVIQQSLRGTFFTVDLGAARDALSGVPWLRSVAVRRQWPATLEVVVVEHVPLARWNDTALVNIEGEVFDAEYGEELPDFYGADGTAAEMVVRYREFASSMRFRNVEIDSLTRSQRGAWDVKLDDGTTIALGREQISERWSRWIEVSERYRNRINGGGQLAALDLRYTNGFAARIIGGFQDAKEAKNTKNTKNNVAARAGTPATDAAPKKLAKAPVQHPGPVSSNRG